MKDDDILISNSGSVYNIKVKGRANFEYAVPLRHFSNCMSSSIELIRIEASECTFMDSTFMGVLAMIGMKAKKFRASVEIHCMAPNVRALLKGLGVDKLFIFCDENGGITVESWSNVIPQKKSALTTAETVAEAHKTLVEADDANAEKFKDVIKFADEDVEKLKKEQS
ncbi:MAG: STAS domain-containing protein [Lentisphaeria bacterium]|nr:STAS domain-containing protein [Lentisphaeria bacterium]